MEKPECQKLYSKPQAIRKGYAWAPMIKCHEPAVARTRKGYWLCQFHADQEASENMLGGK